MDLASYPMILSIDFVFFFLLNCNQ